VTQSRRKRSREASGRMHKAWIEARRNSSRRRRSSGASATSSPAAARPALGKSRQAYVFDGPQGGRRCRAFRRQEAQPIRFLTPELGERVPATARDESSRPAIKVMPSSLKLVRPERALAAVPTRTEDARAGSCRRKARPTSPGPGPVESMLVDFFPGQARPAGELVAKPVNFSPSRGFPAASIQACAIRPELPAPFFERDWVTSASNGWLLTSRVAARLTTLFLRKDWRGQHEKTL